MINSETLQNPNIWFSSEGSFGIPKGPEDKNILIEAVRKIIGVTAESVAHVYEKVGIQKISDLTYITARTLWTDFQNLPNLNALAKTNTLKLSKKELQETQDLYTAHARDVMEDVFSAWAIRIGKRLGGEGSPWNDVGMLLAAQAEIILIQPITRRISTVLGKSLLWSLAEKQDAQLRPGELRRAHVMRNHLREMNAFQKTCAHLNSVISTKIIDSLENLKEAKTAGQKRIQKELLEQVTALNQELLTTLDSKHNLVQMDKRISTIGNFVEADTAEILGDLDVLSIFEESIQFDTAIFLEETCPTVIEANTLHCGVAIFKAILLRSLFNIDEKARIDSATLNKLAWDTFREKVLNDKAAAGDIDATNAVGSFRQNIINRLNSEVLTTMGQLPIKDQKIVKSLIELLQKENPFLQISFGNFQNAVTIAPTLNSSIAKGLRQQSLSRDRKLLYAWNPGAKKFIDLFEPSAKRTRKQLSSQKGLLLPRILNWKVMLYNLRWGTPISGASTFLMLEYLFNRPLQSIFTEYIPWIPDNPLYRLAAMCTAAGVFMFFSSTDIASARPLRFMGTVLPGFKNFFENYRIFPGGESSPFLKVSAKKFKLAIPQAMDGNKNKVPYVEADVVPGSTRLDSQGKVIGADYIYEGIAVKQGDAFDHVAILEELGIFNAIDELGYPIAKWTVLPGGTGQPQRLVMALVNQIGFEYHFKTYAGNDPKGTALDVLRTNLVRDFTIPEAILGKNWGLAPITVLATPNLDPNDTYHQGDPVVIEGPFGPSLQPEVVDDALVQGTTKHAEVDVTMTPFQFLLSKIFDQALAQRSQSFAADIAGTLSTAAIGGLLFWAGLYAQAGDKQGTTGAVMNDLLLIFGTYMGLSAAAAYGLGMLGFEGVRRQFTTATPVSPSEAKPTEVISLHNAIASQSAATPIPNFDAAHIKISEQAGKALQYYPGLKEGIAHIQNGEIITQYGSRTIVNGAEILSNIQGTPVPGIQDFNTAQNILNEIIIGNKTISVGSPLSKVIMDLKSAGISLNDILIVRVGGVDGSLDKYNMALFIKQGSDWVFSGGF